MHDPRPRVVFAVPYPRLFSQHSGVGGHVAHVHGVVHALVRSGFQVDVVTEEDHEVLNGAGVDLNVVPLGSSSLWRRQIWARRFIAVVAAAAEGPNRAAFCYMRYSAGFTPWLARMKRALGEVPLVLEVNSLGSQRVAAMRPLDRAGLRAADVIVCVSEQLREFVAKRLAPDLEERIRVVPNGVDPTRFDPPPAPSRQDRAVHFAFAGLLKPDYGLEALLDAFAVAYRDHPHLVLHLYGDGPLRKVLEERAAAMTAVGEGQVELHEPVPFLDMPATLAAMDVLVYTTTRKYLFQSPIKLLEYMAAGKPIIAAATPQVRELLRHGELGTLFEPGDVAGLASAVGKVVDDPAEACAMAWKARAAVVASHGWERRIRDLLSSIDIALPASDSVVGRSAGSGRVGTTGS